MGENLTNKDLEIFLTPWELEFLWDVEALKHKGTHISRKQQTKLHEIENKLQEIKNEINIKLSGASCKVVNSTMKTRSLNLNYFIDLPESDPRFTILNEAQKHAIKNIKNYWINRVKNYKNWKLQKHWSIKKVTISSRIGDILFEQIKSLNTNKIVQNFIRKFLRDKYFREAFIETLYEQYKKETPKSIEGYDFTNQFENLINLYTNVVSAKILTIEKELFTFYFTFINDFSISYAIRVALIHFRNELDQFPIHKEEVVPILLELLTKKETEIKYFERYELKIKKVA